MYTWKGIFFGMLVPDMVFQLGVGDKCLLTLSTGKNLISMGWKVIINCLLLSKLWPHLSQKK